MFRKILGLTSKLQKAYKNLSLFQKGPVGLCCT